MDAWNIEARPVRRGYPPADVQKFCVQSPSWQMFRLLLKGKPTRRKLLELAEWYDGKHGSHHSKWEREVQVGSYLGALRRGGQLDENNRVKRFI